MKYIHLFETVEDFDEVYNGQDYEEPWVSYIRETKTITFNKIPQHDYSKDYFTVKAITNCTVTSPRRANELPKYRINGGEWTEASAGGIQGLSLNAGDEMEISFAPQLAEVPNTYATFFTSMSGQYEFYGNIFSLMYGDDFIGKTSFVNTAITFTQMFAGLTGLTSAENLILPATTLNEGQYKYSMYYGSYKEMFNGCTSLTIAPKLPATTLSSWCYANMFQGCTSLTTVPELPATTLANYCYQQMFNGCSSLNNIKCLATDISATSCTYNWVDWVASAGTFVKDANMSSWTTGSNGIPSGWTVEDAS